MVTLNKTAENYYKEILAAAALLFVGASFWYVYSYSQSVVPTRSFSVQGEGKIVAVPDVAQLSFGVLTEGGVNLAVLQRENTEKVNRVAGFLKENGVDEKDIKTQFYNISPRYQYFSCPPVRIPEGVEPCPPPEIVGYSINQSVTVKIRDLNKAGDVVSGVVESGANTVSGPSFTVDDPTELQNQARAEAIAKAKEKARAVAEAGGFRLGKLISINEGVAFPAPVPLYAFEKGGGVGGGGPSIEPGSQEVRVNVTLVYEIK